MPATFGSSRLAAEIIFKTLTGSGYRRHMESTRLRLAELMDKTAAKLQKLGVKPWLMPRAGMFLWCRLPEGRMPPRWRGYAFRRA